MIKLKKLINETETFTWKSPTGTPDEVIDVSHKIATSINREIDFLNRYNVKANAFMVIEGPTPDSDLNDIVWTIDKPILWEIKKYWYIGYYEKRKKWKIFHSENRQIVDEQWINDEQLSGYIDDWLITPNQND